MFREQRDYLTAQKQPEVWVEKFSEGTKQISPDYKARLHPNVLQRLESGTEIFFDVHAHCFTHRNIPGNFIQSRVDLPRPLLGIVTKILEFDESRKIAQKLMDSYHRGFAANNIPDKHLIVVMLSMNMEYGISEEPPDNFAQQLAELAETSTYFATNPKGIKQNASVIPFVAIDPNEETALQVFLETFAFQKHSYPFFGIKLYPTLGYLPTHPVLMKIFEICEAKKIPVLTHCGGASTRADAKKIQILNEIAPGQVEDIDYEFGEKMEFEEFFLPPNTWLPVLERFPALYLDIAHLGSNTQWDNYLAGAAFPEENFVYQTLELIKNPKYPNVYADISYSLALDDNLTRIRKLMEENEAIADKLLFGSDYFLIIAEEPFSRSIKDFYRIFAGRPDLIQKLTVDNPKKYLFPGLID